MFNVHVKSGLYAKFIAHVTLICCTLEYDFDPLLAGSEVNRLRKTKHDAKTVKHKWRPLDDWHWMKNSHYTRLHNNEGYYNLKSHERQLCQLSVWADEIQTDLLGANSQNVQSEILSGRLNNSTCTTTQWRGEPIGSLKDPGGLHQKHRSFYDP